MRFITRLGRSASAVVVAAAVLAGSPAFAAPAGPMAAKADVASVSEADALGRRLTHVFLEDIASLRPLYDAGVSIAEAQMKKEGAAKGGDYALYVERFGPWLRPACEGLWEEFEHDGPAFERIVGRFFAQYFTIAELRAAVALYDGPYGKEIRANMVGQATAVATVLSGDTGAPPAEPAKLSPGAQKALDDWKASRDGKSFTAKLGTGMEKHPAFKPMLMDLIAEYLPGAMRRVGEKTEAVEAARPPAL